MDPSNVELLITVIGSLLAGGLGLGAIKIVASAWVRKKEIQAGPGDVEQVTEAIDALRSELAYLRDQLGSEISDVHERLEFAERMLTNGSGERNQS